MRRNVKALVGMGIVCVGLLSSVFVSAADLPWDADLGGRKSRYSEVLRELVRGWPTPRVKALREPAAGGLSLRCIETPEEPLYIGLEQVQWISAPIEHVAAAVEKIDEYRDIFTGFADIRVTAREGNRWTTAWEQKAPVFFVPNIRYDVHYLISKLGAERRVYRFQLKDSETLKWSDGVIILDAVPGASGAPKTRYVEYDFYDAHWGLAKAFGQDRIWRDSVEGIALSDLALRLRAENPAKSTEWVRDASARLLKTAVTGLDCQTRIRWDGLDSIAR